MQSREYKIILRRIINVAIKKRFPGLNKKDIEEVATTISVNIHARMYGANVDGVDSPIWRDYHGEHNLPNVDATELLKENENA